MCKALPILAAALSLAGCARYRPQPLDPPRLAAEYRARNLRPGSWTLDALARAAVDLSPQVALARARYDTARAALKTAGGRPDPTLAGGGGWTNSPESPLVLRFDPAIVVETAGKRGYRILEAQRQAEVARLAWAETEWHVQAAVRASALDHLFAAEELRLIEAEGRARATTLRLLERRLEVGEAARPEVDAARAERNVLSVALKTAEGRVEESRVALAAAIGVPAAGLAGVALAAGGLDRQPQPAALAPDALERAGLLNRADVRRSLAEYAVAEATLRLEIARQYPDISLVPGYGFDEGHHKFSIGPGLAIPLINRNRGPIAEAEARRKQAAAQFIAVQAQAIADIERARAQYEAAFAELREADSQHRFLERSREPAALRAVAAGESDLLAALRRTQTALAALEQAVGQAISPAGIQPSQTRGQTGRSPAPQSRNSPAGKTSRLSPRKTVGQAVAPDGFQP